MRFRYHVIAYSDKTGEQQIGATSVYDNPREPERPDRYMFA